VGGAASWRTGGRPHLALRWYVPEPLPRLRFDLDFIRSNSPEQPGLIIRDPYRYSDALLVVPPALVQCLELFDGIRTDLDLREMLVHLSGQLEVGNIVIQLVTALSSAGFLENETFAAMRDGRRSEFAAQPVRQPAHAGTAYPDNSVGLREGMESFLREAPAVPACDGNLFAIAAPHVSFEGGWRCYASAYGLLRPEHRERTFVILATSHYGQPETFGLTRKTFATPMGQAPADTRLVDWLASRGGDSVSMEDYCHSFEHTVEFQVVFLQHMLGPGVRILPILCGSFARSLINGGMPEDDDRVRRFLDALGELREREGERLFWVLGVDMAHMGARYGDDFAAVAGSGAMNDVALRDQARLNCINAGDAGGFWELVRPNRDDLKWCGSSSFYSFLKIAPRAKGRTLRYEQWNIDEQSVVSFAGMGFEESGQRSAVSDQL
jgi:AmmeMemoRadiSam system protein B